MRGGSQSVLSRTESCQALSFFMRWRGVPLRHQGWERRFFTAVPLACRASSQPNNSRAWGADNFLTFLTASSTALMRHTLPGKLAGGKGVLPAAMIEQKSDFIGGLRREHSIAVDPPGKGERMDFRSETTWVLAWTVVNTEPCRGRKRDNPESGQGVPGSLMFNRMARSLWWPLGTN